MGDVSADETSISSCSDKPKLFRRKRSNSLNLEWSMKYRENAMDNLSKKYASSTNLCEPSEDYINVSYANNVSHSDDGKDLFVRWYKDPKSVKSELSSRQFTDFDRSHTFISENILIFFISQSLKVDGVYEMILIENYDQKLSEFLSYIDAEGNESAAQLCLADVKAIHNRMLFDGDKEPARRCSEAKGLFSIARNQSITDFRPNSQCSEHELFEKYWMVEIMDRKNIDKRNPLPQTKDKIAILTSTRFLIYLEKKSEKRVDRVLKHYYFLKHMFCERSNDQDIPNVNTSLRIGGPLGDDFIIRFGSPTESEECLRLVNQNMQKHLCQNKKEFSIDIWNDTENTKEPLLKKSIKITDETTVLQLITMSKDAFNLKDIPANEMFFRIQKDRKEWTLNDQIRPSMMLEHLSNTSEKPCVDSCSKSSKQNIGLYLRNNPSAGDTKESVSSLPPDMIDFNSIFNEDELPKWFLTLLADIYFNGTFMEGIFRQSGNIKEANNFISSLSTSREKLLNKSPHTNANALKKFISKIDGGLIPIKTAIDLFDWCDGAGNPTNFMANLDIQNKLISILRSLPDKKFKCLQYIVFVLNQVIAKSDVNKMNVNNLSICFGPCLFKCHEKHEKFNLDKMNLIVECIINVFDLLIDKTIQNQIIENFRICREEFPKIIEDENLDRDNSSHAGNQPVEKSQKKLPVEKHSDDKAFDEKSPEDKIEQEKPITPPRRKRNQFVLCPKNDSVESDNVILSSSSAASKDGDAVFDDKNYCDIFGYKYQSTELLSPSQTKLPSKKLSEQSSNFKRIAPIKNKTPNPEIELITKSDRLSSSTNNLQQLKKEASKLDEGKSSPKFYIKDSRKNSIPLSTERTDVFLVRRDPNEQSNLLGRKVKDIIYHYENLQNRPGEESDTFSDSDSYKHPRNRNYPVSQKDIKTELDKASEEDTLYM